MSVLLDDVYVKGSIVGLPGEEGEWLYPGAVQLGVFRPGEELKRTFWVTVPVACHLSCDVADVQVAPDRLLPGVHEVVITVDDMREDTRLLGTTLLSTASVKRRILVAGHALTAGKPHPSSIINSLDELETPPGFMRPMLAANLEWGLFPSPDTKSYLPADVDKPGVAKDVVARYAPWYAEVRETLTFDQKLRNDAFQSVSRQSRDAYIVSNCCAVAAFALLILGVSIVIFAKLAQGAVSGSAAVLVYFIQRTFHQREDQYRADAAAMTDILEYGNRCLLAIQYIESIENPVEKVKHQARLIGVLLKKLNPPRMSKRKDAKAAG